MKFHVIKVPLNNYLSIMATLFGVLRVVDVYVAGICRNQAFQEMPGFS